MGSMEGGGAPLLNDYKLEFFWKRFPQTLLGGLKLKLGYDAPFYVYLNQVLVFLVPFILGGIFTLLAEFEVITDVYINAFIYGGLVVVFITGTQLFSWSMRRNATSLAKFQKNLLSQDDEIDFVSCCGVETVEFIFPAKRFVVNMITYAVISGVVCGLMFLYLLPSNLAGLFSNTGATVVLYTLGWLTVCISQFSLSSSCPSELAIFRALDTLEIAPLMRSFYVVIFGIIGVFARHYSELVATDKALHILFLFLPLLWILGILPALDALFPWLAEQALVLVLGGSPLATDLRLLVMFIISSITVVMAMFISNATAIVVITACSGFMLSMDIFGFVLQAWVKVKKEKTLKEIVSEWKLKEILIIVVMLVLTVAVAGVSSHFSSEASLHIFDAFGVLLVVLLLLVKVLGDVQSVSIFFGLLRNPFFPASIELSREFKKGKKNLKYVGLLRQALLCYVIPLLQVAFLSLFLAPEKANVSKFAVAIGTVRALRQVWQSTFDSLLEISVVYLTAIVLKSDVATWWDSAGLGLQLMLVGACRDRLQQLLNKISFMLTLTVTAWKLPKQRHKATVPIFVASAILLPVVLAVLGAATILAAPLLPLFCLPVFLVGFPRPLRSWPKAASTAAATCPDSVFYKQLTPQVVSTLSVTMSMGSLGNPSPGDHYLVRFQDRLIWVHVLECGYKFCTTVMKGLELQETSCHTVEATRVDDVFQDIFVREGKWPLISLNQHAANVLRPCDTLILDTYSDAKNVLTGIIDQPENLRRNSENFLKTLVWVLVNYCKDRKFEIAEQTSQQISIDIAKQEVAMSVEVLPAPKPKEASLVRQISQDDLDIPNAFKASTDDQEPTTRVTSPKKRRSSSLPSLSDSVWSQDSLKLDESQTSIGKHKHSGSGSGPHAKDEGIDDLEESFNFGGFPALDIGQASASKNKGSSEKLLAKVDPVFSDFDYDVPTYGATKRDTKAGASSINTKTVSFTSEYSSRLDLPHHWKFSIPVDRHNLGSLSDKFPDFWFRHVVKGLNFGINSKGIAESILGDSTLTSFYRQLTCTCYALVEVLGFPGSSAVAAGPGHVHKVYTGDVPWSIHVDWLEKETELKSLILKAYRYAFKLTYDEAVLGEVTSEDELVEYLTEYDRDWYLGSETDHEWQLSIMHEKPFLFSLGRDKSKGTYTSRVLTKQEIMAPIGRLNGECVRGQWASLALELLYFTNDDEERYSIQAHPTLLRNLTIQAADPPLGYPVYSSGAVSVPLVVAPL